MVPGCLGGDFRLGNLIFIMSLSVAFISTAAVFAVCPSTDLTGDCFVNFNDFAVLADRWLYSYNENDLRSLASQWLKGDTASEYIFVDDDALLDPGPSDPEISDPFEDGTTAHPFDAIQKAVDSLGPGDQREILLMDGTYTGTGNYGILLDGRAVTIMSENGYANCIIDCQGNGRAFAFKNGGIDSISLIDGVSIINGTSPDTVPIIANADPNTGYGCGGAISVENASLIVRRCALTDNMAGFGGGAIFCGENATLTVTDSDISFNYCGSFLEGTGQFQMGGGIYTVNGSLSVTRCTVTDNWVEGWSKKGSGGGIAGRKSDILVNYSVVGYNQCWALDNTYTGGEVDADPAESQHGGGIYCEYSDITISDSIIERNGANFSGGGIAAMDSNITISGCKILANDCEASGGGIFCTNSVGMSEQIEPNCHITNCVVAENSGAWCGGIASSYGNNAEIVNCTVTKNQVDWPDYTGGVRCTSGKASIKNTIIWGNVGRSLTAGTDYPVTYCNVYVQGDATSEPELWPGEGNINADPFFADPIRHDYHLRTEADNGRWNPDTGIFDGSDKQTSPCIDAGDPFSEHSLEPVPNGERTNMGAYGNTTQATKTSDTSQWSIPADINGDQFVNFVDFAVLAADYALEGPDIINEAADLDKNGIVDLRDLKILSRFWLWFM